ncbi:MAG: DNA-directed RNA polymerase subunit omega [Bacteroidetes bacterium]|nr:DNA-directed RNA polymerase subunit omega [Bacteroidota bacterium]MCH8940854.1 DNA-directed RNA polymerase subunit omega [Bacteroidota bacterium]
MGIETINLKDIETHASNIYEAIVVCAKKSRLINEENKIEYNALLSTIPEVVNEDDNEELGNPAQLKISLELEKREKPHMQALKEFLDGKIEYKYKEQ